MLIGETIRVALGAIRANAMRSALTTLGIIIGVAAVIAMVALGEGAQRRVQDQIAAMGTNVLTIRPGQNMFRGVSRGDARLFVERDGAEWTEVARADADGGYRIGPLPPGDYRLFAETTRRDCPTVVGAPLHLVVAQVAPGADRQVGSSGHR